MTVHPVSLQAAAHGPEPKDGLEAKFSIPYLTAFTLLHGPPRVESFDAVDPAVVERARRIEVRTDDVAARVRVRPLTTAGERSHA